MLLFSAPRSANRRHVLRDQVLVSGYRGRVRFSTIEAILETLCVRNLGCGNFIYPLLRQTVGRLPAGDSIAIGDLENIADDVVNRFYHHNGSLAVITLQLDRHIHQTTGIDRVIRSIKNVFFLKLRSALVGIELVVGGTGHDAAFQTRNGFFVDCAAHRAGGKNVGIGVINIIQRHRFGSQIANDSLYRRVIDNIFNIWLNAADSFYDCDDPVDAITRYISKKMDISRLNPKGSKVWANEIIQRAPIIQDYLETTLKSWTDSRAEVIQRWIDEGKIAQIDPGYLLYMIWATTQHYADFGHQIKTLNNGNDLSDDQFELAKKTVTDIILRGIGAIK